MIEDELSLKLIELKEGLFVLGSIVGLLKYVQPQTLQTPDIPCLLVYLVEKEQPIAIAYENEEERDAEFDKIKKALEEYRY